MHTLCFYNHKGGVGKTSLTGAVSCELILKSKKVLMIDTDSQGNLSTQFMNNDDAIHELADYLSDPVRGLDFCIYPTRYDNLFIIPSRKISEKGKLNDWATIEAGKLENRDVLIYLKEDAQKLGFDYVVFDMPPSYTELDKKVLLCADEILPVLQIAQTSIDGLVDFYQLLSKLKGRSEKPQCNKLIFNQFQKTKSVQKALLPIIAQLQSKTYFIPNDEAFRKAELRKIALQEVGMKKETQDVFNQILSDIIEETPCPQH